MINSRSLEDLCLPARSRAEQFFEACKIDPWLCGNGIAVIATSTYRDFESQASLYAQGRTTPGKIVTNAPAGDSWHNHRCAFDVLPIRHGKPVWGTSGNGYDTDPTDDGTDDLEVWQAVGKIGLRCGLQWAGNWTGKLREMAHFQYTGGLKLAELKAGAKIPS